MEAAPANDTPAGSSSGFLRGDDESHDLHDAGNHVAKKRPQYFFPENDAIFDDSNIVQEDLLDAYEVIQHERPGARKTSKRTWVITSVLTVAFSLLCGVAIYLATT